MIGVSATGLTVTFRLAVVDAVGPLAPSCEIAVTVRAKSTSEFAGGVTLRVPRFQPRTLIELGRASAGNVGEPSDSVAPTGMDPTVTLDRCSEPSVSVNAALIDSAIALSSLPVAGATVTVGASATGLTMTLRLAVVDAVGPVDPSCEVAVTVRTKSASELAGGVTRRVPRFQPRMLI